MSVQWAAVAGFLYFEVALTTLLIIPIFKPATWKWLFGIRVFSGLKVFWKTAFGTMLVIVIILFLDSIRAMTKYGSETDSMTLDSKLDHRYKECRGQRNFYITGFSLFLMFVIYRLVSLLSERATLEANHTAALRQATNVSRELQRRIDQTDKSSKPSQEEERLEKELKKAIADRDAMKKQAESLNKEYDRLTTEFQALQKQHDADSKKDQ